MSSPELGFAATIRRIITSHDPKGQTVFFSDDILAPLDPTTAPVLSAPTASSGFGVIQIHRTVAALFPPIINGLCQSRIKHLCHSLISKYFHGMYNCRRELFHLNLSCKVFTLLREGDSRDIFPAPDYSYKTC